MTARLGTDSLGKLLLRLSLPGIASMVSISLYNLVDAFWVAKLGYQAIAAVTITMPFFVLCIAIGAGTGVGVNALASRYFGEKKIDDTNRVAGQTFFLSLIIGIVFILVTNVFPDTIIKLAGATPDILDLGVTYIRVLGWGMPMLFYSIISRNVFNASGDAIRPMVFTILGQVCNAILDPCLIFGWGIFPEMGIAGAALATVIANGLTMSLSLIYLLTNKTVYRIKLSHLVPRFHIIKDIYRVGFPSALMQVTESIVFFLFNNVVASFGSVALAAVGIAARIADLAFMPVIGTSHGLLPIIGFSFGARLWNRLWSAVRLASIALVILMVVATIFLEIFTPQVIQLFSRDPELLSIAVPGMRIFCSTFILVGPTIIFITAFEGLSKGKDVLFLSLARQFILFVPGLYILSKLMGLTGVWIAMPISDIFGFITSGLWLYREYRLQKKKFVLDTTVSLEIDKTRIVN